LTDSARRYLRVEHGHQAFAAHQQAVEAVRSVARHQDDGAWRLVGLMIGTTGGQPPPALAEFIDVHGLDGFSQSEAFALYEEAFPPDRRAVRSQRLRERQLARLHRLEGLAAETPQPSDLVASWFDDSLGAKLLTAGMVTPGDLNARIGTGGVWWCALSAIGVAKARRTERHLAGAPGAVGQAAVCPQCNAGAR
jgi:hypothetical protein